MKVEEKGHTVIIKDTKGDINAFRESFSNEYNTFKGRNIILDVSHDRNVSLNDILSFISISDKHRTAKKSFVMVVSDFDYNEAPEEMIVVPTLLEASDIIEMEEIERDLGF